MESLPQGGVYGPVREWIYLSGSCWCYILMESLHPHVWWVLICTRAWPALFQLKSICLTGIRRTN